MRGMRTMAEYRKAVMNDGGPVCILQAIFVDAAIFAAVLHYLEPLAELGEKSGLPAGHGIAVFSGKTLRLPSTRFFHPFFLIKCKAHIRRASPQSYWPSITAFSTSSWSRPSIVAAQTLFTRNRESHPSPVPPHVSQ